MSISEQAISGEVDLLRKLAASYNAEWKEEAAMVFSHAADTIEALTAKLQAANMGRPKANYSIGDLSELIEKFDNKKIKRLTDFEQVQIFNALKYLDMYQRVGTIAEFMELKQNMKRPAVDCGGGWIPCKDRLPEEDVNVLVQVSGTYRNITFEDAFELATYIKGEGWTLESYPDIYNPNIIAWQPLPDPYHEP